MYKCPSTFCLDSEVREEIKVIETELHGETIQFPSEVMSCRSCRVSFMTVDQMQKAQELARTRIKDCA